MGVWLSPVPLTFIPSLAPKPRDWCYFSLELGDLNCGIFKLPAMKEKHLELRRILEIVFPIEQELPVSRVTSSVFNLKSSLAYFFFAIHFFSFSLLST